MLREAIDAARDLVAVALFCAAVLVWTGAF